MTAYLFDSSKNSPCSRVELEKVSGTLGAYLQQYFKRQTDIAFPSSHGEFLISTTLSMLSLKPYLITVSDFSF